MSVPTAIAYGDGLISGGKLGSGVWTAAGEFETYLGRFTGRAVIGVQGDSYYRAGLSPSELYAYGGRSAFNVPNYFTDIVSATFYPIDDLALSVGHIYSFGRNAVTGEVEYLLPQFRGGNIAPSAFVSADYGWNNSSNIMAGIRVYFGNHDKTLIRRQREDDPRSMLSTIRGHSQKTKATPQDDGCPAGEGLFCVPTSEFNETCVCTPDIPSDPFRKFLAILLSL